MRSALLISFSLHAAFLFLSAEIVKFRRVRFVPRTIYTVKLFSYQELPKRAEPSPPAPEQQEEVKPPAEPPPPPATEKPKKKRRPTRKREGVPSSEVKKSRQEEKVVDQGGPSAPAQSELSLDAEEFPFGYYLATIKRKIAARWDAPRQATGGRLYCRVYFRVTREGRVVDARVEQSSESFLFDQAAFRAVMQASPMPPLPEGFDQDYLIVHFSFSFSKR